MRKFVVIDEPRRNISGDMFTTVFDSASEATAAAELAWHRLTAAERRKRHIYSAVISETMLADDAVDEEGNVDWCCWNSANTYDGAFDSAKI